MSTNIILSVNILDGVFSNKSMTTLPNNASVFLTAHLRSVPKCSCDEENTNDSSTYAWTSSSPSDSVGNKLEIYKSATGLQTYSVNNGFGTTTLYINWYEPGIFVDGGSNICREHLH